jgi:hypothetical protein
MSRKIRLSFTKENRALVRAGLKTETRREGNLQDVKGELTETFTSLEGRMDLLASFSTGKLVKSPYGNPQAHAQGIVMAESVEYWMPEPVQIVDMGKGGGKTLPWVNVRYLDDGEDAEPQYCEVSWETFNKILERKERYAAKGRDWREPINPRFMYQDLARTWLPGIRVWPERLGDMSDESCFAEGIEGVRGDAPGMLPGHLGIHQRWRWGNGRCRGSR